MNSVNIMNFSLKKVFTIVFISFLIMSSFLVVMPTTEASANVKISVVNPEVTIKDDIRIKGTTTLYPNHVILVFYGENIAGYFKSYVDDNAFEEEISATDWNWYDMQGKVKRIVDYKPGTYRVYAVHPMGDGITLIEEYGNKTLGHETFLDSMKYLAERYPYGFDSLYLLNSSCDAFDYVEFTVKPKLPQI